MGFLHSEKVYRAMLRVPREEFVPPPYRDLAYEDRPLPIGYGQTISAPSIVAYMTELLDPDKGMKVLEVGTGSGYQAAVLAEIVAPSDAPKSEWGHVYSIERIPELAEYARRNLERTGYADRVTVIVGDGSKGYPPEAPYDRIIVTAAAPRIPRSLEEQLAPGGRMVIPVGDSWDQTLYLVVKTRDGRIIREPRLPVLFVPLI
ncbi:MAG: protein-L-isoaspartate(D-aspartate) O-methyltransferase, partial [Desulfurococcales archaeon]|nr:protein-L-isoaspartate(D-aspartate) O-methyltransferase [Desulfurococcales archaeon]